MKILPLQMPKDYKTVAPVAGAKSVGTVEKPARRVWEISELKVDNSEAGIVKISGYANTKGHADRYGDVPTVFQPLRSYVYELKDFVRNPVMLMNHRNEVESIAGSFTKLSEDLKGLAFEAQFSASDYAPVAHARTVYSEGHGKALSIAGRFFFEDKDNPENLTLADIAEISLVGVGADQLALVEGITGGEEAPGDEIEPQRAAAEAAAKADAEKAEQILKEIRAISATIDSHLMKDLLTEEITRLGQMMDQALKVR